MDEFTFLLQIQDPGMSEVTASSIHSLLSVQCIALWDCYHKVLYFACTIVSFLKVLYSGYNPGSQIVISDSYNLC